MGLRFQANKPPSGLPLGIGGPQLPAGVALRSSLFVGENGRFSKPLLREDKSRKPCLQIGDHKLDSWPSRSQRRHVLALLEQPHPI
jgi:hypothetical protein